MRMGEGKLRGSEVEEKISDELVVTQKKDLYLVSIEHNTKNENCILLTKLCKAWMTNYRLGEIDCQYDM
jgi:hypothetical protein